MGLQEIVNRLRQENDRVTEENAAIKRACEQYKNTYLDRDAEIRLLTDKLTDAELRVDKLRNDLANETQAHSVCKLNLERSYTRVDYLQNELTQFERYKETDPARHITPINPLSKFSDDEIRISNDNYKRENHELTIEVSAQAKHISRLQRVSRQRLSDISTLKIEMSRLNDQSSLARAELADRQHEFKRASDIKAENANLETKIAMLEAKLKTYDGILPAVKPKDIVLLDRRPSRETARMNMAQQEELKSRLSEYTKKLEIAAQTLGYQEIALEAYRKFEKEANAEMEPFRSSAQGNEWVFGFLAEHRCRFAKLWCTQDCKWVMTWADKEGTPDPTCIAENLGDLNKVVHEKLLELMPDPAMPGETESVVSATVAQSIH